LAIIIFIFATNLSRAVSIKKNRFGYADIAVNLISFH